MGAVTGHKDCKTHSRVLEYTYTYIYIYTYIHMYIGLTAWSGPLVKQITNAHKKPCVDRDGRWLEQTSWCTRTVLGCSGRVQSVRLLKNCLLRSCRWTKSPSDQNTKLTVYYWKSRIFFSGKKKDSIQQTHHGFDKPWSVTSPTLTLTALSNTGHRIFCT